MNTLVLGGRPGNIGEAIFNKVASTGAPVLNHDCWNEAAQAYLPPEVDDMVEQRVHQLVCSLGATHMESFMTISEEDIAKVMWGSLMLPLLCARRFIEAVQILDNRSYLAQTCKIVFIGSYAHDHPLTNGATYCAAKAGINAATKELAWELTDQGIMVHVVNPYHVPATPMGANVVTGLMESKGMTLEQAKLYQKKDLKMGSHLTKEEIAEIVHWLLTDPAADWTAGQPINLYGGSR